VAIDTQPQQQHGIHIGAAAQGVLVYGNITHGNAKQGVLSSSSGSAVYGNMEREAAAPSQNMAAVQ
jgi:hypothetical protein